MTRPVRLSSSLADDIDAQLDEPRTADFWTHDVVAAVALLSKPELWDSLPVMGADADLLWLELRLERSISLLLATN